MPVKKTVAKKTTTKPATKTAKKPVTKHVAAANVVEVKKPTVVVETKKTDRCECGDSCNCGNSCTCGCKCGWILKICILVLIVANLILSCILLCSKWIKDSGRSAWDLEALKVWGEDNLKKLENDLYSSDAYKEAQRESIQSYLDQLWID